MFDRLIKYFSVVSIGTFILSYAYLHGYYSIFKVNIINFITTSEIFYALLPLAILILSFGYSIYYMWLPTPKNPQTAANLETKKKWWTNTWIYTALFALAGVGIFIIEDYFHFRGAPFIKLICWATLFFIGGYEAVRQNIKRYGVSPSMVFVIYALMGYLVMTYGKDSALIIKELGNTKKIIFKSNKAIYRTNDSLIFVGETQSTLFLFHKKDTSTWILPRSNIDSLIIINK